MNKRGISMLLVLASLLLFSSCDIMSDDKRADIRLEQIITAMKEKDRDALKSLFSEIALEEAIDLDNEIDDLFELLHGDIVSWERTYPYPSGDTVIDYGKISKMIRFGFNVKTDEDDYEFYIMDYNEDTINPDNQGVYMLELIIADKGNLKAWSERMRAGIYIH